MKIVLKVRFNSTYPKFEKVLGSKYILYIPEPQTNDSENFIKELLSRKLGIIKEKISVIEINQEGEWFFHIED